MPPIFIFTLHLMNFSMIFFTLLAFSIIHLSLIDHLGKYIIDLKEEISFYNLDKLG